jgi:hypothetical protein
MQIAIDSAVFETAERSTMRQIDRLFSFIEEERHIWLLKTENELDAFVESSYLENQSEYLYKTYAELAQKTFDRDIYNTTHKNVLNISIDTLNANIAFLQETVYVILENLDSDRLFINALLRTFGKDKKYRHLHTAISKSWLQFQHAGGKDGMPKLVNYHFNRTKQTHKPRLFILFDSDRLNNETNYEVCKQQIIQRYNKEQVPCHVLYKREIENYLPISVLATVPEILQSTYEAYCNLNPHQKDFYDMENGFGDKGEPSDAQKKLYANIVNTENYKHLRKGFNRSRKDGDFIAKRKFPAMFENEQKVMKQTLTSVCSHQPNPNELTDILNSILSLL